MLNDEQLAGLSPLGREFRNRFLRELPSVPHSEQITNRYELVIPPAHPSVGELRVWDDGDELTIGLGEHHHWHVPLYMYDDAAEARRPELAAATAVDDIRRVLEGRTVLRVTRRAGKVVSSTTYDPERSTIAPPTRDDTEYLWDGPRV